MSEFEKLGLEPKMHFRRGRNFGEAKIFFFEPILGACLEVGQNLFRQIRRFL